MVYRTGSVYEGEWVQGVKQGVGSFISSDGSRYDGTWVENTRDGKGGANFSEWRYLCWRLGRGVMQGIGVYIF